MKRVLAASILFLSSACASIQVKPELMKQVKTVAIVNLEATNQMTQGGTGGGGRGNGVANSINAVRNVQNSMNGTHDMRNQTQLLAFYDLLSKKLTQVGMQPMAKEEIAQNAKFQELYAKIPQWSFDGTKKTALTFATNELRVNLRDLAERKELMDALGVDAVAQAEITIQVGKTGGATFGGFGALKRYPQAVIRLYVYDKVNADPIWVDYRAVGEVASDGLQETMGVADTKDPTPLFVEAAGSAFENMLSRYEEAKNAPPPQN